MIQNKRNILDSYSANKQPRLEEEPVSIPWLTLSEWQSALKGLHDLTTFPDRVAKIKATMAERIQIIKVNGKVQELAGHVLWLDITEEIPIYVVLENGINQSFFAGRQTRQKVLGLPKESLDITVYSQAQNDFAESGKSDADLRDKLKGAMARKSRPLASLKWDSCGEVMEIVWLQAFRGFDQYPAISGPLLKKIVELFEGLLPPSRMTILADQAKSGSLLLRKIIPLTKDYYVFGPGYYGSWDFIPSNCWNVRDIDGKTISQSRMLYYSAVQTLRGSSMDDLNVDLKGDTPLVYICQHYLALTRSGCPDAKRGFDHLIEQIYENEQPPRIEKAKEIILNTVIWEKRRASSYVNGYFSFCLFEENFLADKDKETYQSLVSEALKSPRSPCWLT